MATRAPHDNDAAHSRLERELGRLRAGLASRADLWRARRLDPTSAALDALLEEWHDNLRMQLDFLAHFAREEPAPDRMRSEVERARRDLSRWMRRRFEHAEARLLAELASASLSEWLDEFAAELDALPTFSARAPAGAFEARAEDDLGTRWRRWRARKRSERMRAVPLAEIAARAVWPLACEEVARASRDAGAIRATYWRRIKRALVETDELWAAASERAARGLAIDWSAFAQETSEASAAIRSEMRAFAADTSSHLERTFQRAARDAANAASVCDTPLLPLRHLHSQRNPSAEACAAELAQEQRRWDQLARGLAGEVVAFCDGTAYASAVRYAMYRDAWHLDTYLCGTWLRSLDSLAQRAHGAEPAALCSLAKEWAAEHGAEEARDVMDSRFRELDRSVRRAAERVTHHLEICPSATLRIQEHEAPPELPLQRVDLRAIATETLQTPLRELLREVEGDAAAMVHTTRDAVLDIVRLTDVDEEAPETYRADAPARLRELVEEVRTPTAALPARLRDDLDPAFHSFREQLGHLDRAPVRPTRAHTAAVRVSPSGSAGPRGRRPLVPESVGTSDELLALMHLASLRRHVNRAVSREYWRLIAQQASDRAREPDDLEAEFQQVLRTWRAWEEGDPEAIAVVGADGAGKSVLLDRIAATWSEGYVVHRARVERRVRDEAGVAEVVGAACGERFETLHEVRRFLDASTQRRMILLDAGERLFLRQFDGLGGIRALLALIADTADRVLWVVSFESLAFEFLGTVLHLADGFTQDVRMRPLNGEETLAFLERRHRLSGLSIEWARESGESGQDARSRLGRCFAEASHGHPPLVLLHWLLSVEQSREGLTVHAPVDWPSDCLSLLESEQCAALAAVMLHGGLNRADFSDAMRLPEDEAASLLAGLRHLHLVEMSAHGGRLAVGEVRYPLLVAGLRARHVL